MPDGRITWARSKWKSKTAGAWLENLAGSVPTMDRAVRNVGSSRMGLQWAVRLATLNPARMAEKNEAAAGRRARDLLVLSPSGEVRNTIVRGVGI